MAPTAPARQDSLADFRFSEQTLTDLLDALRAQLMRLKPARPKRARTVGYIPHDARVRVDRRVKDILARREAAVERARRAARRLKDG